MIEIPQSFVLTDDDAPFANIAQALDEPNGLIGVGGVLSTERLIDAYRRGIFPWYGEGEPVQWYSPNPRMVVTPARLHISKSLKKTFNQHKFNIRIDQDFDSVIRHCKTVKRKDQTGTWIDGAMVEAYTALHQQGVVKSVEAYQDDELVGGLYGVTMGRVFFGESMFSLRPNASKIAFVHLVESMGYKLIDCQVESPHLKSLGAFNIERSAFINLLDELL